MKFKIGDKVRVNKKGSCGECIGKVGKIISDNGETYRYTVKYDTHEELFNANNLELVTKEKPHKMTDKEDNKEIEFTCPNGSFPCELLKELMKKKKGKELNRG